MGVLYLNLLYGLERLYKGAEAGVLSVEGFPFVTVAFLDQTLRYDAELLPVIFQINMKRFTEIHFPVCESLPVWIRRGCHEKGVHLKEDSDILKPLVSSNRSPIQRIVYIYW